MVAEGAAPLVAVAAVEAGAPEQGDAIVVRALEFGFPPGAPVLRGVSLTLPRGSRCLLTGANGAGKTTLLQVLAGKYLVNEDTVRILGRPAFHDLRLASSGDLSYLGPQWRRDVASAGTLALQGDISAGAMLFGVEGADPRRRADLISLLEVDLDWRMNRVSDGQRRRVQIALGLLKPYRVLLLDEVTVDMDVVGRLDLLEFFKKECAERGATIVYATHIFDGMEGWPTHAAYVEDGAIARGGPVAESLPGLGPGRKLLHVVEGWLREERDARRARGAGEAAAPEARPAAPYMPSKHMSYYGA